MENKTVAEYMRAIKSVADELAVVGSPLNNGELIVKVMSGLGPEYKEISAAIRARDTPISFEELFDKLADHEIFLKHEETKKESVPITAQLNQKGNSNNKARGNNFNYKKGQASNFGNNFQSNQYQGNQYQGNRNSQGASSTDSHTTTLASDPSASPSEQYYNIVATYNQMALLMTIILSSLPIFLLFLLQKHIRTRRSSLGLPPGPRGLPFIGNLHQFDISNPSYLLKLSKQYGPLMSLQLGFVPTLVVSSAKMSKEVMKTHDLQFCSRPSKFSQKKLTYNFSDLALSPYNDYWREMRKICVVHLFNSVRVQQSRPIREDEISRLIEKISKSSVANSDQPVNLSEMMISLTNSIICRVALGKRYDDEGIESSRFHALLQEIQAVLGSFFFSDYFPYMGWADKLTGMISRLEKNFEEFDKFYQEVINEHLDSKRPQGEQEDIIDDIFVAGTETSAASVIWAMTYLMKHPRVMKKAQEEIRDLTGKKDFVDEDDIRRFSYLEAVLKETMRLQPVVPLLLPRETNDMCILDGYEIPPKMTVLVNAWAIGRDPEAWENPDEFYPERFIGSSIDMKGQNFELVPFGAGRRSCPGMVMGIVTVELALANLLYKFDWEMPVGMKKEDLNLDSLPGIAMHKKNALCLVPKNHM
ncbi:hypothetical protein EZV62_021275 [Acer yangbiense]|uniref:Cytochrome P450 n=1 Tax=Acer yangbiense TaxID=1000413 RepID=A0A5C7H7A9_9ROSI|nr:hypothetical protein EZV62_021275 [Acer yangbiense]